MSFDLSKIYANTDLEAEGVWIDFYEGSRLKIASTDSKGYRSYLADLARKNKLQLDDDNPDYFDIIQDLTCEALSRHVLKDWEGIDFPDQPDVQYTHEVGKAALMQSSKLRSFVEDAAGDYKTFKDEVKEELKNS